MAAKEAPRTDSNPFAPAFALTRSALADAGGQSERWLAWAGAQHAEGLRLAREMTAHALAATQAMCDAAEENATRAVAGAAHWPSFAKAGA